MMMRLVIFWLFGTVLAACSGSGRVEEVLPRWANTPSHSETPQYEAHKKHLEGRKKPDTEPQGANTVDTRSLPEE